MRAKVISVSAVIIFYLLIAFGIVALFGAYIDSPDPKWFHELALVAVFYGFIGFIVAIAYLTVKWILKE